MKASRRWGVVLGVAIPTAVFWALLWAAILLALWVIAIPAWIVLMLLSALVWRLCGARNVSLGIVLSIPLTAALVLAAAAIIQLT